MKFLIERSVRINLFPAKLISDEENLYVELIR